VKSGGMGEEEGAGEGADAKLEVKGKQRGVGEE